MRQHVLTSAPIGAAGMPPQMRRRPAGWRCLDATAIGGSREAPVRVSAVLLHPVQGIALVDVAPRATPHAVETLRQTLAAGGLRAWPAAEIDIAYLHLTPEELRDLPRLLRMVLALRPGQAARPDPRWTLEARAILARLDNAAVTPPRRSRPRLLLPGLLAAGFGLALLAASLVPAPAPPPSRRAGLEVAPPLPSPAPLAGPWQRHDPVVALSNIPPAPPWAASREADLSPATEAARPPAQVPPPPGPGSVVALLPEPAPVPPMGAMPPPPVPMAGLPSPPTVVAHLSQDIPNPPAMTESPPAPAAPGLPVMALAPHGPGLPDPAPARPGPPVLVAVQAPMVAEGQSPPRTPPAASGQEGTPPPAMPLRSSVAEAPARAVPPAAPIRREAARHAAGPAPPRAPASPRCGPLLARLQLGGRPSDADLALLRSACAPAS